MIRQLLASVVFFFFLVLEDGVELGPAAGTVVARTATRTDGLNGIGAVSHRLSDFVFGNAVAKADVHFNYPSFIA